MSANRRNGQFPRSMLEAWPYHYPHSITRYRRPLHERIAGPLLASAIGAGLALVLFFGLSA